MLTLSPWGGQGPVLLQLLMAPVARSQTTGAPEPAGTIPMRFWAMVNDGHDAYAVDGNADLAVNAYRGGGRDAALTVRGLDDETQGPDQSP